MHRAHEPLGAVVEARLRRRCRQPLDQRPRDAREPTDALGQQVRRICVVAAEQLVAALAGERDLHVLRGELRDEVRWQRGRVRERLVESVREGRQEQRRVRTEVRVHDIGMCEQVPEHAGRESVKEPELDELGEARRRNHTCLDLDVRQPSIRATRADQHRRIPRQRARLVRDEALAVRQQVTTEHDRLGHAHACFPLRRAAQATLATVWLRQSALALGGHR